MLVVLPLSDDVIDWLNEKLDDPIVFADDLDRTYAFDHEFNGSSELLSQEVEPVRRGHVRWRVGFTHPDGRELLELPMQRTVYPELGLCRGGRGPLVENDSFHLVPAFWRRGFGSSVYASEARLFRRWGVREIHLTAVELGRVVWLKGFDFLPVNGPGLELEYKAWLSKHPENPKLPFPPKDYPEPFLYSLESIMLFKALT